MMFIISSLRSGEGTWGKKQLTHVLGQFDAFHGDIECGGVFDAGVLPPPLHHLDHSRLPLDSRRRTEELQAKLAANVDRVVCADELKEPRRSTLKESSRLIKECTHTHTLRNAQAMVLKPRSCLSASILALASSIVMKSTICSGNTKRLFDSRGK